MIGDKGELPIAMALASVVTTNQMVSRDRRNPAFNEPETLTDKSGSLTDTVGEGDEKGVE